MRRKTVFLFALTLVLTLIFTACAARRPLQTPTDTGLDNTDQYNNYGGNDISRYTAPNTGNDMADGYGNYNTGINDGYGNNYRDIGGGNTTSNYGIRTAVGETNRLKRTCESVSGVEDATVVILGNTAYVGLDMDRDTNGRNISFGGGNNLSTVKSQCVQRVKAANPKIKTVYVSTDEDFFERVRKIGDQMRNGSTVNSFRNELSELVRDLTPER